ncbi:rRNA biogenesis protein-like protein [Novymonas esmeraldas]|uniref:rRNA biogenesis protein-like protein n=1 Tax=Novymonas esmeraldas TaxID=1808958 RepID=A0AAW0F7F3_9TRYP
MATSTTTTTSAAAAADTPLFRHYRVHHSTPDGLLVQLPETNGFGRITAASLGNDTLAKRLLSALASREHVLAIPTRARDAQGYRQMTVDVKEGFSAILTYPAPVRRLTQQLVRKHMLVGLGTTTAARLVRSSAKGSVLMIQPRLTAVAALEELGKLNSSTTSNAAAAAAGRTSAGAIAPRGARTQQLANGGGEAGTALSENSDADDDQVAHRGGGRSTGRGEVEVRLLNYDVDADVANVTAATAVVEGTPLDTAVSAAALATLHPGDVVTGTVLLSSTDDGCAVVHIPIAGVHVDAHDTSSGCVTLLGYYIYNWDASATATAPVVGHTLTLVVELCPEVAALRDAAPFVIVSHRTAAFQHLPAVRRLSSAAAGVRGLLGHFPWREEFAAKARRAEGDSSDDEDGDEGTRGRGTAQEPQQRTRRRKLEEAIDAYERGMGAAAPTSPEEFQRLLLANPNSSYVWTQYMAHHVGLQQLEAARQVAEKALSTIGVREQEELLNVWVAYLNIENLYGTEESLAAVFRRAQQRQLKQLALFERLADILAASRKPNQLLALCRTMTGKFRTERRTWERLGIVLVDQNKRDQLKRTLKDMGEALKGDDATRAIVHIAIHEYKHGNAENGRALFEGLLRKVPKRSDVWSTYIDQETGLLHRKDPTASALQVRQVFQRTVAMNFSAKVMQQLLTRFLAFEKLHGTPGDVEAVKERARVYVEAKIHAVADAGNPSRAGAATTV